MACRYFVAVKPSKNIRISINQIIPNILSENDLDKLRLVRIENLHLTLFFLGHRSDDNLNMDKKIIKRISSDVAPFDLQLDRIEPFPHSRYSRGLWISGKHHNMFTKLNDMLSLYADSNNSNILKKKAFAHCTIARFKHYVNKLERLKISTKITTNPIRIFLKFRVDSICLFKTRFTKNVLFYELLEEYLLQNV